MLVAPHCVGGGRGFADALVGVREREPDVEVGSLLLDEQMLLPILGDEPLRMAQSRKKAANVRRILPRRPDRLNAMWNAYAARGMATLVTLTRNERRPFPTPSVT